MATVAVMICFCGLTSCSNDEKDIIGTWESEPLGNEVLVIKFKEDGKMTISERYVKTEKLYVVDKGEYKLESGKIIFTGKHGKTHELPYKLDGDKLNIQDLDNNDMADVDFERVD